MTAALHGYADNDGVRIHYAEAGEGPLVVMIHGFPDFWYTWRHQIRGLMDAYRVVAIDEHDTHAGASKPTRAVTIGK